MDETVTAMAADEGTGDKPKSTTIITKPTSKYVREFEFLFVPIRREMLISRAQGGQLRHCQFRSLCWRYFLRCLPSEYNDWLPTCDIKRREYEALKTKHQSSIKSDEINNDKQNSESKSFQTNDGAASPVDPHMSRSIEPETENKKQSEEANDDDDDDRDYVKLSNQCDYKNVLRTIERDVVRTFPDMEFFRQTEMQEILSNILFNFATKNPHISYKQGMHELLAAILYVCHTDSQVCLINYEGDYANETIASLLNIKYLEHDVYLLFSNLMKSIETWYQNDEILTVPKTESSQHLKSQGQHHSNRSSAGSTSDTSSRASKLSTNRTQQGSVLGNKLMKISENIVKRHDSELFYHLEALQIAPQIFGIRWMRLLFSREFEFLDLLTVWDAIICDQDSMSLVDYVFASMLITIRDELVNGDYTHCLNNLMRYQFKDVAFVVNLALHIRDPNRYSAPKSSKQTHGSRYSGTAGSQHPPSQKTSHHHHHHHQKQVSSLTSKLSQQYLNDKLLQPMAGVGPGNRNQTILNPTSTKRFTSPSPRINQVQNTSSNRQQADKQHLVSLNRGEALSNVVQDGLGYLAQQAGRNLSSANNSAKNKFLPNINKFVSSIGQNIQDKTNFLPPAQWQDPIRHTSSRPTAGPVSYNHNMQARTALNQRAPAKISSSSSHQNAHKQYHQISPNDMILSADPSIIKEFEMREMQSTSTTPSRNLAVTSDQKDRLSIGQISSINPNAAFDVSTESYDDLHSIVDYCWRLLSEQIDSLQRCLPKEKSLHSEDEIFVALAQLKKVRDVLKGSLKLEDELESAGPSSATAPGSKE